METISSSIPPSRVLLEDRAVHARALEELNERFYTHYAGAFHSTRGHGWRGWRALLQQLEPHPMTALDIGCGSGRLADCIERLWLDEFGYEVVKYIGLERSSALLSHAEQWSLNIKTEWHTFDWSHALFYENQEGFDSSLFNQATWATLFGVMHHIYSFEARVAIIEYAAKTLKPGGALSVSLWDFGFDPRYDHKYLSWETALINHGKLSAKYIEDGDKLLGWAGEDHTPRFCHWFSRDEEEQWIKEIALRVPELRPPKLTLVEGDKNRYWTWVKSVPSTQPSSPISV